MAEDTNLKFSMRIEGKEC